MAVALAISCSSDLTPSLGTSLCVPKKQGKKKRKKERKKRKRIDIRETGKYGRPEINSHYWFSRNGREPDLLSTYAR